VKIYLANILYHKYDKRKLNEEESNVDIGHKQQNRGRRERMDIGMRTRRITSEDTREKLAKLILDYAKENKLTESNIKEALQDVKRWMRNNAIIT